jgi:class 3 adenylate cyclase
MAALPIVGIPALLHLFLAFPVPNPWLVRLRTLGPPGFTHVGGLTLGLYMVPLSFGLLGIAVQTALSGSLPGYLGSLGWVAVFSPVMLFGALWALLWSYRCAPAALARAQVKWILWALGILIVAVALWASGPLRQLVPFLLPGGIAGQWIRIALLVDPIAWAVLPLAIGLAILRYRLFDIDLLINRTVVYGILAGLLAAVFFVVSTLSQRVFEDVTGQHSDLVPTGAGVLVALVFQPMRRRTKFVVDRILPPRQMLVLLFADIVGSTERLVEVGDERWTELLGHYRAAVRRELKRNGGHEVDTAGDGFFATFQSPLDAVQCARAMSNATRQIGLAVRVGLHLGEVEMRGEAVSGLAVHAAARLMALGGADDIIASSDMREALEGSGALFADRGAHTLKGLPGEWHIYRVTEMPMPAGVGRAAAAESPVERA